MAYRYIIQENPEGEPGKRFIIKRPVDNGDRIVMCCHSKPQARTVKRVLQSEIGNAVADADMKLRESSAKLNILIETILECVKDFDSLSDHSPMSTRTANASLKRALNKVGVDTP